MATAVLLSEVPGIYLDAGKRLRHSTLRKFLEDEGFEIVEVNLLREKKPTIRARLRAAFAWARTRTRLDAVDPEMVCVAGLGAAHLLPLAALLSRHWEVVFDACDSWRLQTIARREAGHRGWSSQIGLLLVSVLHGISEYSYISERDADADLSWVEKHSTVCVIPNSVDGSLACLSPVHFPLSRIVLPVDMASFHNRWFFENAADVVSELFLKGLIPEVLVSGRVDPRAELPLGFVHAGWLPDISEIYEGDTGVIISNIAGSGVPNKFLEALAAGRPMLVHSSLRYLESWLSPRYPVHWWSSADDIRKELPAMLGGSSTKGNLSPGGSTNECS